MNQREKKQNKTIVLNTTSEYESFLQASFGDAVFDVMQHASSEITDNLTSYLVFETIIDIEMKKDDTTGASNRTDSKIKTSLNVGESQGSNFEWNMATILYFAVSRPTA